MYAKNMWFDYLQTIKDNLQIGSECKSISITMKKIVPTHTKGDK